MTSELIAWKRVTPRRTRRQIDREFQPELVEGSRVVNRQSNRDRSIVMTHRTAETSPQLYVRIGGVLYLITIFVGIFNEALVKGSIVVPGDATATAANLRSMESLWRLGIAGEMIVIMCTVALTLVLYVLLRPVSRDLALLATFFSLIATAVNAAYSLQLVEALFPLGNAGYLKAFTPEQLNAMASLSLKSHVFGFGIGLLLFGPFFLVSGYLIFRSTYFPRVIGILYQIGGVAYLANGFVLVLAPSFANQIFAAIVVPAFVGEVSFCLWLLFKGVNVPKWEAKAATSA